MNKKNICELARTIRSKNAGSFMITMEIIFDDRSVYDKVKRSGAIDRSAIARAYDVADGQILDFVFYDPGMGIKANIRRINPSGGPGETDLYGCQHYPPIFELQVPWDEAGFDRSKNRLGQE